MEEPHVRHVEVLGFEKRFVPSQHYVYMLMVKWSDLSEKLIYRKFSEIYDFHGNYICVKCIQLQLLEDLVRDREQQLDDLRLVRQSEEITDQSYGSPRLQEKMLKELFPIEAGEIDPKARTLPHLPAPRWLEGHKTTENRQSTLADYFQTLLSQPPKISRCQWIMNFLQARPDDVAVPTPHPTKKTETYLLSKGRPRTSSSEITGPMLLQTYRSIADYQKNSKYEMNIQTGDVVEIVEKHENGWWFCQMEGRRGWLPAAFLEPLDGPDETEEQEPNYEGERYKVIRSYVAMQEDEMSLNENDVVDVIHKLLDGWWVVRKYEATGYYPSMYLQKSGCTLNSEFKVNKTKLPPPRRSTIRNAKSIHGAERKRISQETYRRNSRRYLQQKASTGYAAANRNVWKQKQDPRTEKLPPADAINKEEEIQKMAPEIPPRPTINEIMAHCTERTKSKIK